MYNKIMAVIRAKKTPVDHGHIKLVDELTALLGQAEQFEYHSRYSNKHKNPKAALRRALTKLIDNLDKGFYGN